MDEPRLSDNQLSINRILHVIETSYQVLEQLEKHEPTDTARADVGTWHARMGLCTNPDCDHWQYLGAGSECSRCGQRVIPGVWLADSSTAKVVEPPQPNQVTIEEAIPATIETESVELPQVYLDKWDDAVTALDMCRKSDQMFREWTWIMQWSTYCDYKTYLLNGGYIDSPFAMSINGTPLTLLGRKILICTEEYAARRHFDA